MGMLLHRHLYEADLANKPVQTEPAPTIEEMPKDIEQAVVEKIEKKKGGRPRKEA